MCVCVCVCVEKPDTPVTQPIDTMDSMAGNQPGEKAKSEDREQQHQEEEREGDEEEEWVIQRNNHKAAGDDAFRGRAYRTAIDEYTKAISFDPDSKDSVVLYSNRSAAYLSNSEISKSLQDARTCVDIDPLFTKGHSRLGAALFALRRYEQSKESYQKVLKIDPKNVAAQRGIQSCDKEIERRRLEQERTLEEEERQRLHDEAKKVEADKKSNPSESNDNKKNVQENNGVDGEDNEDDDDLLNDFFDEVEDVITKRKEEVLAAVDPSSSGSTSTTTTTNAIRNDRQTLGTTKEQVDRLLQSHYEWRNLNPYYVLQLPAETATDDDISRRYKALSLLLHPDKNAGVSNEERDRIQLAYDQVQKAKTVLSDPDRKRYTVSLIEEGMKQGKAVWSAKSKKNRNQIGGGGNNEDDDDDTLEKVQEREVMRLFAQVEQKRRDVEERERKYEQREQQKEDDELNKERKSRQFDKSWRKEDRVDKRVGNWRDFSGGVGGANKKQKK